MSDSNENPEEYPIEAGDAVASDSPTEEPVADPVVSGAVVGQPERAETEDDPDGDYGRGKIMAGWVYLSVLFVVFVGLALLVFTLPDNESETATSDTTEAVGDDLVPVDVLLSVDHDTIALAGAVPDDATVDRLVELADARYADGEVIDELTVDDGTTLDQGHVTVSGVTVEGDPRPEGISGDVAAALGLAANPLDVTFETQVLSPASVSVDVSDTQATVSGAVPSEEDRSQMVAVIGDAWGTAVDDGGLVVGDALTMDGATITVSGSVLAGDLRVGQMGGALVGAFGEGVNIDISGLEVDTSDAALADLEEQLRVQLAENPILFEVGSAVIDAQSAPIVEQVAAAIQLAPGIEVEIVGHTDSTGSAEANQTLSEERAAAVLERLVELGVERDRLTSKGVGADEPVASNDTAEGQAQNRRIEFLFGGEEAATDDTADDTADDAAADDGTTDDADG